MAYRDYEEFIAALNAHGVRYLVVGAHAVAFHARPRASKDLDVLIDPTATIKPSGESQRSLEAWLARRRKPAKASSRHARRLRPADDKRRACILETSIGGKAMETPGVTQELLVNAPLAQFPGKRVLAFTGEFQPGARTPFHRHPGTELFFVLDGQGVMTIRGREPKELTSGKMVLVEPDSGEDSFTHEVVNLSDSDGLKTLVIVIHDEGAAPALPPTGE
jgi:quercetin dioxygenase-like cupin family protein